MLRYDEHDNVLYAYKNKCAIPKVEEMLSTSRTVVEDLTHYYNTQVIKDFNEFIRPELEKVFQNGTTPKITILGEPRIISLAIDDIASDRYNFTEKYDAFTIAGHRKHKDRILEDRSYHLQCRFHVPGLDDKDAEWITVLKLPYFDPQSGIITIKGTEYSFNYMLEQSDGISYVSNLGTTKKPSITIKTSKNPFTLEPSSKGIKISLKDTVTGKGGKINPALIPVMAGMLRAEDFDVRQVWNEFRDIDIINLHKTEGALIDDLYYYGKGSGKLQVDDYTGRAVKVSDNSNPSATLLDSLLPNQGGTKTVYSGGIINKLMGRDITPTGQPNKMYDTTLVRDELNEVLSLKAGIGSQLYEDVVDDNGNVIKKAGTVLSAEDIEDLQRNGIYKIYIRSIPNIVGGRIASNIFLDRINIGTLVSDVIADTFPEEDGMYTTKTHYVQDVGLDGKLAFIVPEGTIITNEIMSLLVNSGVNVIDAYLGTSNTPKKIYFYEEIISNRQFKGKWIGKTGSEAEEWFYKDSSNNYIPQKDCYGYRAYDLVALLSCATKVFNERPLVNIPNIDTDFRKTLATPSIQFARAMQATARETLSTRTGGGGIHNTLKKLANEKVIVYHVHDEELNNKFYAYTINFNNYLIKTSKCLRRMSQDAYINPIAYISEVTKANVFTKGKHSVTDSQRAIAIGSYGKIDAFEIPQSGKMGVVNNLTTGVHFDSSGRITTPYHKVSVKNGKAYVDLEHVEYLDVVQEEKEIIADICSLHVADDGTIAESIEDYVLCRVPGVSVNERQLFERYPIKEVTYVTRDAIQTLSWSSAVIPFVCNNDAARAVFAIAQIKQCKGHRNAETPSVMTTAYKMLPLMNNVFGMVCHEDGYVLQSGVDRKTDEHICTIEYPAKGQTTRYTGAHDSNVPADTRIASLYLTGSNSYTDFKYNADCHQGDTNPQDYIDKTPIKKGQAAVGSNFISDDGFLKLGVDLLVAYRPNYNYEDSTCLSESAARKVCTYRVNKEIIHMPPSHSIYCISNIEQLKKGNAGPNEEINTVEVSYYRASGPVTQTYKLQSAYGKYLRQIPHMNDKGAYDGVELWMLSEDYVEIGDKFSNRHGNKATVSKIFPDNEMPKLKNGMAIDMELNPLGVGSRMNIGQILEMHMGLVCHVLGIRFCADAYNGINEQEVKDLLSLTVDLADSTNDPTSILNQYNIPENLKAHCIKNINKIRVYANCFTKDGTTKLILPNHEGKMTETECLVGWVHEFKLIQESATKLHARGNEMSFEPYASLSDAPTKGASNAGGQRLGNMEVSALAAYNANGLMHEIMNERSDNAIARNNFNVMTYLNKKLGEGLLEEGNGQRRSVTQLLYTLLALGVFTEATEGEIIPLSKENHFDLSRPKPQLLRHQSNRFREKLEQHKQQTQTNAGSMLSGIASSLSVGTTEVPQTPQPIHEVQPEEKPVETPRSYTGFAASALASMDRAKVED